MKCVVCGFEAVRIKQVYESRFLNSKGENIKVECEINQCTNDECCTDWLDAEEDDRINEEISRLRND